MRRPLVVAVAIALAGLALPSNHLSTAYVAAAQKGDGCPAKLGSLRLSSSSVGEESTNKGELRCLYASKDFSKNVVVRVSWLTKSAGPAWLSDLEPTYCLRTDEDYVGPGQHGDKTRWGYAFPHAGDLYILAGYLATEKGPSVGRIKELGRELVSGHAGLAATCPGAAEPASIIDGSPSDAAGSADTDGDPPAVDPGLTETTVILSGTAAEDPPAIGTKMALPEDDRHELVVGGPDGEVIREEYIGDSGTITGYGPLVTDADGNWSVLVTVDVGAAPEPTPEATLEPTAEPTPEPSPGPPTSEPTEGPTDEAAVVDDTPASADLPAGPTEAPAVAAPVEGEAPPEPIEPIELPDDVPDLTPEGAGAVRNIADHVLVLGEMLEDAGRGETTIPASDIASLRALKPGLVKSVRLGSGSIIVTVSPLKVPVEVLVTPVIGEDGLIAVKLSRFEFLETHEIVRALVAALNGHVADRGGRFRTISVTPESITVTAEGSTPE